MNRKIAVLVVGEERGRRPRSVTAPDLRPLLGRPAAAFVLETVSRLGPASLTLACPEGEGAVSEALAAWYGARNKKPRLRLASYKPSGKSGRGWIATGLLRLGSLPGGAAKSDVLIVSSTRGLLRSATLKSMLAAHRKHGCSLTLLGSEDDSVGIGAVLLRAEDVLPVVLRPGRGRRATDCASLAKALVLGGKKVGIHESRSPGETRPLSLPSDFVEGEKRLREMKNAALARRGVLFLDPETSWIDWDSRIGPGTVVYPSVVIEGASVVGRDCRIFPHVHVMNSRIGDGVKVLDCTVIDGSVLEAGSQAGPFSRLRPGTVLRAGARVGNFVEMKNTDFGPGSKAQHLSYLGDTLVEEGVNVGAGTITCNYDGVRKSRTHIGAGAFIGSGTELVAPVRIGKGAYVAAGSTIGKDVSPGSLAIARARQVEKPGWVLQKIRERKKAPKP